MDCSKPDSRQDKTWICNSNESSGRKKKRRKKKVETACGPYRTSNARLRVEEGWGEERAALFNILHGNAIRAGILRVDEYRPNTRCLTGSMSRIQVHVIIQVDLGVVNLMRTAQWSQGT